jgi:transcriptional regulator with PAS, ATPase and Fis domain
MSTLIGLLSRDNFFSTLFESMPLGVMLVDENESVLAVNDFLRQFYNFPDTKLLDEKIGDLLRCADPENNCDREKCQHCTLMPFAREVLKGAGLVRRQVSLRTQVGQRTVLVTAAPVDYAGENYAILLLEDISELQSLRRQLKNRRAGSAIIGRHTSIADLQKQIQALADVDVPVLIQGESGVGKELVASAIHKTGKGDQNPFIAVNCGALPDNLLESELFGHVRGAFTGAIQDRKGRFELANGGTIFLDEIGDISQSMQVKLLRVLQEGTFEPVGGEQVVKVDVRVISATNKDLKKEIAAGRFREDLFYRISVVPITVPPLRERRSDIPHLAYFFLENYAKRAGGKPVAFSPGALNLLLDFHWPGNIRELQNVIQYALIQCRGDVIEPRHLPASINRSKNTKKRSRKRKLTREAVNRALERVDGNKVRAAKELEVSRATLYRFISEVMKQS